MKITGKDLRLGVDEFSSDMLMDVKECCRNDKNIVRICGEISDLCGELFYLIPLDGKWEV